MSLSSMLKGISGEYEINRVVGAAGALTYIVGAAGLTAFEVMWRGRPFDLVAWCTAFPAGLGIAVGAIAGAVAIKDRNVAAARQAQVPPPIRDEGKMQQAEAEKIPTA
jgi:hypothetical protein